MLKVRCEFGSNPLAAAAMGALQLVEVVALTHRHAVCVCGFALELDKSRLGNRRVKAGIGAEAGGAISM